jgi:hypothetical protein
LLVDDDDDDDEQLFSFSETIRYRGQFLASHRLTAQNYYLSLKPFRNAVETARKTLQASLTDPIYSLLGSV